MPSPNPPVTTPVFILDWNNKLYVTSFVIEHERAGSAAEEAAFDALRAQVQKGPPVPATIAAGPEPREQLFRAAEVQFQAAIAAAGSEYRSEDNESK